MKTKYIRYLTFSKAHHYVSIGIGNNLKYVQNRIEIPRIRSIAASVCS